MKKTVLILTVICMLTSFFAPLAFADNGIGITSVTYTSADNRFILTVRGICEAGMNISLLVKNEDGVIKAIQQCRAGETDTFAVETEIDVSGDSVITSAEAMVYTVSVRNYKNEYAEYFVPLYTESAKDNIVQKFNAAVNTAEEIIRYTEEYSKAFGFNMTFFDAKKKEIAENMLNEKAASAFTSADIERRFNLSVIKAYLFDSDFKADRTQIIEYPLYSAMLGFETGFNGAKSLYPEYKQMTDSGKARVNAVAFQKANAAKTTEQWKEALFMAVTASVFEQNKEELSVIKEFLQKHNDWFALEKQNALSSYQWSQILSGMSGERIPDNQPDFTALYNKYLEKVTGTPDKVTPPSVGGSGSSGGAGGRDYVTPAVGGTANIQPENPSIAAVKFEDLQGYDWAKEAIEKLAAMKIVNGKSAGKFAPGDSITREEFAKILVLAYKLYDDNAQCNFSDIAQDRWSYSYIASIYQSGIAGGYPDGSFCAESLITREEMAVMLCRVLVRQGKLSGKYASQSAFQDYDSISDFAVHSVLMLNNYGIISGDDNGRFNPQNGAARAEVCKMIYNSMLYCKDEDGKAVSEK